MHCAICDDDYAFLRGFQKRITGYCDERDIDCRCSFFLTPSEFLLACLQGGEASEVFDIVFLNVDMVNWDGINIAKTLRSAGSKTLIIFVSAFVRFAPAGYGVGAFRYLLKDELDESFAPAMDDALQEMDAAPDTITIKNNKDTYDIPLGSIVWVESQKRTLHFVLQNYPYETLSCYMKLGELEDVLRDKGFLRIHKSFLVNLRHVAQIKNYTATLKDGRTLQTSRQNFKALAEAFAAWNAQRHG